MAQVRSSSLEVLPWQHCPVHLSVLLVSSNKMKCTFEPRIHIIVTYIWHVQVSVRFERKMDALIIQKQNHHSKKFLCVLILLKYELYEVFYTEIFHIYNIYVCRYVHTTCTQAYQPIGRLYMRPDLPKSDIMMHF